MILDWGFDPEYPAAPRTEGERFRQEHDRLADLCGRKPETVHDLDEAERERIAAALAKKARVVEGESIAKVSRVSREARRADLLRERALLLALFDRSPKNRAARRELDQRLKFCDGKIAELDERRINGRLYRNEIVPVRGLWYAGSDRPETEEFNPPNRDEVESRLIEQAIERAKKKRG